MEPVQVHEEITQQPQVQVPLKRSNIFFFLRVIFFSTKIGGVLVAVTVVFTYYLFEKIKSWKIQLLKKISVWFHKKSFIQSDQSLLQPTKRCHGASTRKGKLQKKKKKKEKKKNQSKISLAAVVESLSPPHRPEFPPPPLLWALLHDTPQPIEIKRMPQLLAALLPSKQWLKSTFWLQHFLSFASPPKPVFLFQSTSSGFRFNSYAANRRLSTIPGPYFLLFRFHFQSLIVDSRFFGFFFFFFYFKIFGFLYSFLLFSRQSNRQ